jgi:hypothetical protein
MSGITSLNDDTIPQVDRPGEAQRPWPDRWDTTRYGARPDALYQHEHAPHHGLPILGGQHREPNAEPRPPPGLPDRTELTEIPDSGLSIWTPQRGDPVLDVEKPAVPGTGIPLRFFRRPAPMTADPDDNRLRDFLDDRRNAAMVQLQSVMIKNQTRHILIEAFQDIIVILEDMKAELDEEMTPERMQMISRLPFAARIREILEQVATLEDRLKSMRRRAPKNVADGVVFDQKVATLQQEAANPMHGISTWSDWLDYKREHQHATSGGNNQDLWDAIYWWNEFQKNIFVECSYYLEQNVQAVQADVVPLGDALNELEELFFGVSPIPWEMLVHAAVC